VEHVAWATHGITEAGDAMSLVLIQDRPLVTLPQLDPAPDSVTGGSGAVEVVLAQLEAAAAAVARRVDDTYADDWRRTGVVGDGSAVSALALLAAAVHFGAHHLRATDRTVNEVARELPP
jgi:hypothetical protein